MALHVLAYNLTRVINIVGIQATYGRDEGIVRQDKGLSRSIRQPALNLRKYPFLHKRHLSVTSRLPIDALRNGSFVLAVPTKCNPTSRRTDRLLNAAKINPA